MEQVRLILALASFAIGALIALRYLFRRPQGRRRSPVLGLLYSSLFVVAGVWLLQRSAEPPILVESPRTAESPKTQPSTEQPKQSASETSTTSNSRSPEQDSHRDKTAPQASQHPSDLTSEAPIRLTTSAPWDKKLDVSRKSLDKLRPDLALSKRNRKAEDVVEDAVISAFDWIEFFFARYASTNAATAAPRAEQSSSSARAKIQFVSGSSELDPASESMVRAMAPTLVSRFPSGALVVRAAAEGDPSNPALRNMLAQARAQAVCQVLSSGGFPADRLIASATEASADASGVEFVHRP